MTTVLIVEDDPINLKVFSKILSKRGGLNVIGTENVDEVLKVANSGVTKVILMDVSLSNSYYDGEPVDGIRITQLLKANPVTHDIPVVLITAHAMEGDKENFLNLSGADGYITKPIVDQEEFVEEVKSFINGEWKVEED
ncbi:response regulator receiver protein [Cyanobacterium stanieri PCC 7202]|uniref:Response regulator receiver protein n=1 Tax=Cyanobacterium stanieri (strain ATCC 29140 / PCC 7202) TaxID=292563 RepID=K9YME1_CYASC|nr:response regulator receiver protein [Cyanobacterium stanieri PCC 7202]